MGYLHQGGALAAKRPAVYRVVVVAIGRDELSVFGMGCNAAAYGAVWAYGAGGL